MVLQDLDVKYEEIESFCRHWDVVELAIFGSALGEDFRSESDVDLLISFRDTSRWRLFDLVRMEEELELIFRRDVDLVEKEAVQNSENYIRRARILNNTHVIFRA